MTVILTVEDEFLISELLSHVLSSAGYEVLSAANADEAVAILEERSDIRVVITDVNMPGSMDGLKLATAIKGRWPPIEIIITTGMGKPQAKLMPEGSVFLPKPHTPATVLAAVNHVGL